MAQRIESEILFTIREPIEWRTENPEWDVGLDRVMHAKACKAWLIKKICIG